MLGALLYLRLTSLKNMVRTRLQRLRQPKYLVGAVVGVAYFWFFFFRHTVRIKPGRHASTAAVEHVQAAIPEYLPMAVALGGIILFVVFFFMWLLPLGQAALGFTEAEIAFLFPAPISRRSLVHYKLLGSQFSSLFGAAIMVLFSQHWTFLGGNAAMHAVGWWFLFSAINLHQTGSSFTLTRLSQRGVSVLRRRLLLVALVSATAITTVHNLPPDAVKPDLLSIGHWLQQLAGTAPLVWLLLPVRLIMAPFFTADGGAFLLALGPALLVLGLHYLWVVRSVVSFEEASIVKAEKRAATVAAWRSGERRFGTAPPKEGRRPPFALADTGRPELAFLWKNLLSTSGLFSVRTLITAASIILLGGTWALRHEEWHPVLTGVGIAVLAGGLYLMLIGPQFARQDIRSDLNRADILKTYPLAGWQVILGELLTPVAILTGILWLVILTAALLAYPKQGEFAWLVHYGRFGLAGCLALVTPALVGMQMLVPNAATLLFPDWFHSSRHHERGIEVMGQRMIFLFAQFVTMLVSLVPGVLLAGLAAFAVNWLLGPTAAMIVATLMVLAVLLAEIAGGLWWLGRRFERFDLSAELR